MRLVWFSLGAGAVVSYIARERDAGNPMLEYKVRALVVVLVALGAYGWWRSNRRDQPWGFELVPVLVGTIASIALTSALAGTDFGPGGLANDQSFRTAAVTRFADSWHNADYTMRGLPSFYPPSYFWVLGRMSHVLGVEPWRMLKIGALMTALLVPTLAFVLWRRIVPDRIAALFAIVVILVNNFYEPYSWLVIVAIVPWWLEAVHGLRRDGAPPGNPVALGIIGAVLFMTYTYFFALAGIAFVVHLGAERVTGSIDRRQVRRAGTVLGVTLVWSSLYWVPFVASVLRADHPSSFANRWFTSGHTQLPLPMVENTAVGIVAMIGFVYLVWNVRRDPVARGLLTFLVAAYCWYLIGAVAVANRHPLLSFRGKPMIPLVLMLGGVLGLVRMVELAAVRWDRDDVQRVTVAITVVLGVFVCQRFVTEVRSSSLIKTALETERPDAAAELEREIVSRVGSHATLLSVRLDVLLIYPNHAFVPWDAHYANPASEYSGRIAYLAQLAQLTDPAEFARRATDNQYERIDAFVLAVDEDTGELVYRYTADDFPNGIDKREVRFSPDLFAEFDLVPVGGDVLAVRR